LEENPDLLKSAQCDNSVNWFVLRLLGLISFGSGVVVDACLVFFFITVLASFEKLRLQGFGQK
jgi:hypothetical protein